MQDNLAASRDPAAICTFDYEAIQAPTKPLIHQSARFIYIKRGKGTIEIGGVAYDIKPNMLVAVAPWSITEITQKGAALTFALDQFDLEPIAALAGQYPGRMLFSPGDAPALTLKLKKGEDPLRVATQAVERYAALLDPEEA